VILPSGRNSHRRAFSGPQMTQMTPMKDEHDKKLRKEGHRNES